MAYKGPVSAVILDMYGGLRSACTYIGAQTLMLLKSSSSSYRLLNCSALYAPGSLTLVAAAAGATDGPPCSLLVEGLLPVRAPCSHSREHCLLAPHCG